MGEGKAKTISGLKKIDDHTLEITLARSMNLAYSLFPINVSILPQEAFGDAAKPFSSNPVGLGPFKLVKWVKGSEIVLERFEDYYEKGLPYLDKLVYKIMGDSAARDIAFRAKELDANLLYSSQYAAMKNDPEYNTHMVEVAEMYTRMIAFNQEYTLADGRKPFTDVRVRKAFNYAINSKLIIEKHQKGKAYPAKGFLASTTPGYDPEAPGYDYDPEKAKSLMKEAGYGDGFPLEIVGTSNGLGEFVWYDVTTFTASGSLTSAVLDRGGNSLLDLDWTAETPLGTSLEFQVRGSDDPANLGLWSAVISAPGPLGASPGRYIQYQVTLTTNDPGVSPVLKDVSFSAPAAAVLPGTADLGLKTFPNPANPRVIVAYEMPASGSARLQVFDTRGSRIRTLLDEQLAAGPGRVAWDGTDSRGRAMSTGVYYVTLNTAHGSQRSRVTLIR